MSLNRNFIPFSGFLLLFAISPVWTACSDLFKDPGSVNPNRREDPGDDPSTKVTPENARKISLIVPGGPEDIFIADTGSTGGTTGTTETTKTVQLAGVAEANDFDTIPLRATVLDENDAPVKGVDVEFRAVLGRVPTSSDLELPTCEPASVRTDVDGKAEAKCKSDVDGDFDLRASFLESPDKKLVPAKVRVRFFETLPEVEISAKRIVILPKTSETTPASQSDSTEVTASVIWGNARIPSVPILIEVDRPTVAALSTDGGVTLVGNVQGQADDTGILSAGVFSVSVQKDLAQNTGNEGETVVVTAVAQVQGQFLTDTTTIFVGGPSVIRLEIDGPDTVTADGTTAVKIKATAVSFVPTATGQTVGPVSNGTPFTFQTTVGVFQNGKNKMTQLSESSGTVKMTLTSTSDGEAVITVSVPLADKVGTVTTGTSNPVRAFFQPLNQELSCLGLVTSVALKDDGTCGVPCTISNDDDTSTPAVENEVKIIATAQDSALKPISNVKVTFCALPPHSVSGVTTSGTTITTDSVGRAEALFRAGFSSGQAGVRAYVGCPQSDPCSVSGTKFASCQQGGGTSSTAICADLNLTVKAGTGASIEFLNAPLKLGVKGTGNETGTIDVQIKDKKGNPVANDTEVQFTLQGVGGGESIASPVKTTGGQGKAQTVVKAGTVSGTIKVIATVILPDSTSLIAGSQNVAIEAGPPVENHLSVSRKPVNFIGYILDGEEIEFTAFAGDRYGNPVTTKTTIFFASEAGVIEGKAGVAVGSTGSVATTLFSANPRPKQVNAAGNCGIDGRGTVVAYTKGIENYIDMDGDGSYIEDGGCVAGLQCAGAAGCAADPFEGNGKWDSCDDANRNGLCDVTEPGGGVCALGEDIFCILRTIGCTASPCLGYSKLRPSGLATPDLTRTPDLGCQFVLHDTQEPFINANETYSGDAQVPSRDFDEVFLDVNGNGKWDTFNNVYDSVAPIWADNFSIWSGALNSPRTDLSESLYGATGGIVNCPAGSAICATEGISACRTLCIDTLGEGPCRVPDALDPSDVDGDGNLNEADGSKDEFCILGGSLPNGGSRDLIVTVWDDRLLPVVGGSTLNLEVSGSGAEVKPSTLTLDGFTTRVIVSLVDANTIEGDPTQGCFPNCNPVEDVDVTVKLTGDNVEGGGEVYTKITCRVD